MARRGQPLPTKAELDILSVLWQRGPSTVREVQEVLESLRPTGYTTVLKLLQLMVGKGLVKRDESHRSHVYEPARPAASTRRGLLAELVDRGFGGSTKGLILQALDDQAATADELVELRRAIDERIGARREKAGD